VTGVDGLESIAANEWRAVGEMMYELFMIL
jgi:hypothetical protein